MRIELIWKIVFWVVLCLLVGQVAGYLTLDAVKTWYPGIVKPSFNPPNWVFAPVWIALYIVMGVAAGLVWSAPKSSLRGQAMAVFTVHLLINAAWSLAFFYMHSPLYGLLVIAPLWVLIVYLMALFGRIRPLAAWLLLPYLLWVSFAAVLNTAIFVLNR